MGGLGDMSRRNITRGLDLGGEAVRDERGQVVGVINRNQMGGRVYSGRPGYDPFAPPDNSSDDDQPSAASTASTATPPPKPPAKEPAKPPAKEPAKPPAKEPPADTATDPVAATPKKNSIQPGDVVYAGSGEDDGSGTGGKKKPKRKKGGTIMTGAQGVIGDAPIEKSTLLGGG